MPVILTAHILPLIPCKVVINITPISQMKRLLIHMSVTQVRGQLQESGGWR